MLPIIRTFISLPAGVARMPFWRFTGFTLAGCVPWVLMLAIVGREVGDNWEKWRHNLAYLDYLVLAAAIGLVVYLILRRRRGGGPGEGETADTSVGSPGRRRTRCPRGLADGPILLGAGADVGQTVAPCCPHGDGPHEGHRIDQPGPGSEGGAEPEKKIAAAMPMLTSRSAPTARCR